MGTLEAVYERLERALADGMTTAAACVIVRNGRVLHRSAHGITCLRPPDAARKVNLDTWFDVASLTKIMATTAIAMALHGERRLALDTPVSRLLLEFSRSKSSSRGHYDEMKARVTVEDLLTHRSGLPDWAPYWERVAGDWVASRVFTSPEERPHGVTLSSAFRRSRHLARELICAELLDAEPGDRVLYSDPGFIILGMVLERAGGAPLDVLFKRLVAEPIGLARSFFVDLTRPVGPRPMPCAANRASGARGGAVSCGEVDDENAFALAGVAGHAGIFSTVDDVAAFGEAMRRLHSGERIGALRPFSARTFLAHDTKAKEGGRALGFDVPSGEDSATGKLMSRGETFGHLGFTGCSLWFDLSRELTVALLTNRVHVGEDPVPIRRLRGEVHDLAVEFSGG